MMNNILNQKVEIEPINAKRDMKLLTMELEGGYFTGHQEKLICYIDLLGIADYYKELSKLEKIYEVKNSAYVKLLKGFLSVINTIKSNTYDIYSFHILSDTIIIVPKSEPINNKEIPTIGDFFKNIIFKLYQKLLEHNNPCKILITRGQYFSLTPHTSNPNYYLNILPGGKAIIKCHNADKNELKGKGPGIFSNLKEFTGKENSQWDLINLDIFYECINDNKLIIRNLKKARDDFKEKSCQKIDKTYQKLIEWISK